MFEPKLRRPEFRRRRALKRRALKRKPFHRILKQAYANFSGSLFPSMSPLVAMSDQLPKRELKWGGQMYWDVALTGPVTTRITSQEAVSVNYADHVRAPISGLPCG